MIYSNKTRVPQQQRSIETKEKIEQAAIDLFSTKGFHRTNAKQIADTAGVSVGSFYAYFENKKTLFMEIFRKHCKERIMEIISTISAEIADEKKQVHQIIQAIMQAHGLSPEFHREVLAMRHTDPEVETFYLQVHDQITMLFLERLRLFGTKLRVEDLEAAAAVVCSATQEVYNTVITSQPPIDKERLLEALSEMIYRYLFFNSDC